MSKLIDQQKQIQELVGDIKSASWVSVDTEANSMYAYPERVCLLQLSTEERDAIVDTLAKGLDLKSLFAVLRKKPLIMHGADYDLRLLYKGYKFRPLEVFDTMLAAKLLGEPSCGLAQLCEAYMGVHLVKKHQKADWGKRPLPQELLSYAIKDSFYLHELKRRLEKRLIEEGKLEWHRQNCERLIKDCTTPVKVDTAREWRLGGSENFSRRELGLLRALWYWREAEAIRSNRPLFFIMRPDTMTTIARLAGSGKDFKKLVPRYSPERKSTFFKAVEEALQLPVRKLPLQLRREYSRFSPYQQRQLEHLIQLRDQKARELDMEPTLIASRADLVGCVRESDKCHLTEWQKEALGFSYEEEKWVLPTPPVFVRQKRQRRRRPYRQASRAHGQNNSGNHAAPASGKSPAPAPN
ncbi:MAG: ribonuclease D, partial [Verrucomicrobiota bacterium]|nr:ribonuclease D [Verrucomicrobiota bacterium]